MKKFLCANSIPLLFANLTVLAASGRILVGWHEFNDGLSDYVRSFVALPTYIASGLYLLFAQLSPERSVVSEWTNSK